MTCDIISVIGVYGGESAGMRGTVAVLLHLGEGRYACSIGVTRCRMAIYTHRTHTHPPTYIMYNVVQYVGQCHTTLVVVIKGVKLP